MQPAAQQHPVGRSLPAGLAESLRAAFAHEVAERLPRLLAAGSTPGPDALRDAHTLASSAAVVGEPEAALAARAAERHLRAGEPYADDVAALALALGWPA